ncbi:MAG: class I SAM-dependent methyltransferase [Planctomycetota bacterium]|nr:class I SAM-dependent methyltransferase [Planctomycetota bacterium]
MNGYRWNAVTAATGYDEAAAIIHPRYQELQDRILAQLPVNATASFRVLDAGGGSGRLLERILQRYPHAHGINLDQSEAFLSLAERRLHPFGSRIHYCQARLQDNWETSLPGRPHYIVSMSAIHHLDHAEKEAFYRRCFATIEPGGIFINGDEVRPTSDEDYLASLREWALHMRRVLATGQVSAAMQPTLEGWIQRNVNDFGVPKKSGDDCHETTAEQLQTLRKCGFTSVEQIWAQAMWAAFMGTKPNDRSGV